MAISEQDLTRIATFLEAALDAPGEFRRHFPGLSFTRCDAADLSEEPFFRRYVGFDLYLVDGRSHCWRITTDPARATGIVVARRPLTSSGLSRHSPVPAQHKETA